MEKTYDDFRSEVIGEMQDYIGTDMPSGEKFGREHMAIAEKALDDIWAELQNPNAVRSGWVYDEEKDEWLIHLDDEDGIFYAADNLFLAIRDEKVDEWIGGIVLGE